MSEIIKRQVGPRGCGYPIEGGFYIEAIGAVGGMLPRFVSIDPALPWHFSRGVTIVDGDFILEQGQIKTESEAAFNWERRQALTPLVKLLFSEHAQIIQDHIEQFHRELIVALDEHGFAKEDDGGAEAFQKTIERIKQSEKSLRRLAPHVQVGGKNAAQQRVRAA
ncbi:MAG: hypothetical protein IT331_23380 [Anaerolineae bacterium]|nr:hypothetical protein [Anaerolineae bacterium]